MLVNYNTRTLNYTYLVEWYSAMNIIRFELDYLLNYKSDIFYQLANNYFWKKNHYLSEYQYQQTINIDWYLGSITIGAKRLMSSKVYNFKWSCTFDLTIFHVLKKMETYKCTYSNFQKIDWLAGICILRQICMI